MTFIGLLLIRLGRLFGKKLPLSFGKELALEADILRGLKLELGEKIHAGLQEQSDEIFKPYRYADFALLLQQLQSIELSRQQPEPQNIVTKPAINVAELERSSVSGSSTAENSPLLGLGSQQVQLSYRIHSNERALSELEQQAGRLREHAGDKQRYEQIQARHNTLLEEQRLLLQQAEGVPAFSTLLQHQQLLAFKIKNYVQLKYQAIAEYALRNPPDKKILKQAKACDCYKKLHLINESHRQKKRILDG